MVKGVWVAFPNLDYFGPDDGALRDIFERLFTEGVQGALALGTTGQGPDKSLKQRMNEVERLSRVCLPRQLIIGVTANASEDVRDLIAHAASCGVRGVAVTAPYYGKYAEEELYAWLNKTLSNSPTEIEYYMYNIPGGMHHRWTLGSLQVAAQHVPIAGIKDSSGDVSQLISYLEFAKSNPCSVLVGDERLGLYNLLMGGAGFVSGFATAFPGLICRLYEACVSRNVEEAAELQQEVNRRVNILLGYPSRAMVGVIVDWMRENGIAPART
ncbi:MAG: dihydrodipicolinate synthase family protein [Alicyclobacillus sp.]|nr:dihydrodipicolinate synthase family protein [Alicyclobacillus sp.]